MDKTMVNGITIIYDDSCLDKIDEIKETIKNNTEMFLSVMRLMFLEMKKKMVMLEIQRLRTTWCYLVFQIRMIFQISYLMRQ